MEGRNDMSKLAELQIDGNIYDILERYADNHKTTPERAAEEILMNALGKKLTTREFFERVKLWSSDNGIELPITIVTEGGNPIARLIAVS